ncbi:MAG TPA: sigma-70 family RNA polymerase sigma factor [Puia sp.]|nr:sigma-70 family RNA polymerase sigma factor [Puia sp.]
MRHYGRRRTERSGSDENWFERFRNGDTRGMNVVFKKYNRKLVYYAMKLLGDISEAEEIASGALQKAWDNRDAYQSPRHLNNSLYEIVKNDCISLIRKRGVEDRRRAEVIQRLQSDDFDINKALDDERARAETIRRIWQIVNENLDRQSAEMFWLRYEAGWSDARIAEFYQMHPDKVRGIRARTVRKLRKIFGNDWLWVLILLITNGLK